MYKRDTIKIILIITTVGLISVFVFFKGKDGLFEKGAKESLQPETPASVIPVNDGDHIRGNINAPITIVEWSDFQCSFCREFHDTLKRIMSDYPDDVRWVYRHFPLDSMHPYAHQAAEAAECAGEQGKFWEYSDVLYQNQWDIKPDFLYAQALQHRLDADQFERCLSSGKYKTRVDNDFTEGLQFGVRGTPGSFINGRMIAGNIPHSRVREIIEELKQYAP